MKEELKKAIPAEVQAQLEKLYGIKMRKEPRKTTAKDIGGLESETENNDEECADGEHCPEFKQIREEELLSFLQEGWTITKELRNGDIIVQQGE